MPTSPRHRRPLIEALEPRLLFSATADIAVFDDGHSDGQYLAQAAEQLDLLSVYQPDDALASVASASVEPVDDSDDTTPQADIVFSDDHAITTLVFVDTRVDNYEVLVNDIQERVDASSVAIIYLDSGSDGLAQISEYLAGFTGISAIHVISHGVAGNLQLGNQVLNETNLAQFKGQLAGWQTGLTPDADILLYGCELAANQSGLNLLQQLSDFTGADVAASNDLTGNSRADADWELEARIGQIEAASIFSSDQNMQWQGVLADVVHLYSGVATNEQAIPTAGYVMQGVQLTSSQTVDRIQVMLANHGTSSTSVQMLVHQNSYNGTVVASATVNTATLGNSLGWVNFDFAQTTFNAYTVYWVEFRTNNGADNLVGIGYINSNVIASEFVVNSVGDSSKDMSIALVDVENRIPTLANPISDQVATEEAMYSYTFAANTFNDQDGDTLTYTATRGDGTPLPAWLNFNAATRTFSGVPDDGDVGTISVKVTANDGKGGTVDDTFNLVINNVNDAPFVNAPVSNQDATEDSVFNFIFPANTFGDGDVNASFTYTAELADGNALPAWLHLDSATRTFSGTPANADVGTISVKLIANDGAGGIISDTFDIVIANTNDAPVVANALVDQVATESSLFNYSFPTNTFSDPDVGDTLTYSAQLAGALPLPGWLTFDAATRTFNGTPSNGDVGSYTVRITATDSSGSFTTHDFDIVVQNVGSTNSIIDSSGSSIHTQILSTDEFYQSFTNNFGTGTYTIDSIILQLQKDQFASTQTITVTLREQGPNDIDGAFIASATMSSDDLGTLSTWKAFDFTNTVLTDGVVYFIAIESSSNDGLVAVGIHNTNVYPDGSLFYSSGTEAPDRDLAFQIASGANTDPVLMNPIATQNATEDVAFNFQFASNVFSDADGDTLIYSATLYNGAALPSWLSFNAATRTFSGTPTNNDVGTISIKITATDGLGGTPATDTFDLVIANTNDAPTVAIPIANQNATEDALFNFTFAANTFADQDLGNTLTYTAQLAGGGALPSWLNFDAATRTFSGTPTNAFVGTVSIDVIANDGNGGTVTDTFNIVVENTNDAPTVANAIPDQNATEDMAFNFQFLPNTFNDPDTSDTLIYSAQLAGGGALPSWLSFNAATRTFSGTPTNADVGSFSVDVIASDTNGGSVIDTFNITVANVNDAPSVSIALTDYYADENTPINLHGTGITISDVDSNNITLTLTGSGAGSELTANVGTTGVSIFSGNGTPTLVLTGTLTQLNNFLAGNNGGTLTYRMTGDTPPATATLTISANDGALTGNDTATINIGAINNAPINTVPGAQVTNEDTALVFSAGNSNQIQISDVDAAAGTLEITLSVTNGTLTLAGTTGLSFTTGDGTADSTLVFSGTLADINAALATLTYNPTANYSGGAVLSITTSDLGNTGTGGTLTDTDTVNITVNAANDAPTVTITPTTYSATEQTWMDLHATGISVADIDGDILTITLTGAGSNSNFRATVGTTGAMVVSGIDTNTLVLSGTAAQLNNLFAGNNGGTLTYLLTGNTPVSSVLLTISASDGMLTGNDTATINITAVNDAPENTVPGAQTTNEETALVFSAGNSNSIQVNDLDVGSGDLEVTLSVTNGVLTLAGITGLSFTTGDGTADSSMVFRGTQANINAALATLTFNPTANFAGSSVLTITTSDLGNTGSGGTQTDTDTVNITVNGANDAPTIANVIPSQNATEDSAFNFQFAANTFADIDGDTLTYSAQLNGGGALPSWLSFNAATRTFSGTPANGDVGTISIDVTASDGNGGTVTDTFDIVIANTNDAPTVANAIPNQNATEDAAFNFQFDINTFADVDANTTLTYSAQLNGGGALPAWLTFDAATRTFSGTPANGDVGTIFIDVTASDGSGGTVVDTFDIVIANTNDAPTVANAIPNQNATEDAAFNFQFASNTFADVDGNTLTYSAQLNGGGTLPSWLNFNATTRTFSGTPTNGDVGTISIDVTASDGNGGTIVDTFDIVIANANDAPTVANAIPDQIATEDAAFNFQFDINTFADVDANTTLTYSAQLNGGGALPAWLTFDAATRTFSGIPAEADVGIISIDVIANDANGGTATDTFTITINSATDNEYIDTGGGGPFDPVSSSNQLGQSFAFDSAGATYTVNEISLYLARYDQAAAQTITVELRDAWNGAIIASDSIPSSQISRDGFEWHTFSFAGVALNDQQTYVIQISSTGSDGLVLVGRASGDVFAGGTMIENGVPNAAGWDLAFKVAKDDGANAAPVFDFPIADQVINAEAPFNLVVPANTSSDPDPNDTITYRAQLAGGGSLGWLTFNEATRTFAGTPHWHQAGTMTVELIATDNHGASTSDFFQITVVNTNTPPTVATPIPDRTVNEDAAFSFQFAANTFADVDAGTTFTYSAQLAVLGGLPPWLSFDAATRTFSGTPGNADVGNWTIEVTANDGFGGTVVDTFVLTVANTNDAPTILNPIGDQTATEDVAFNFQFVANTFTDIDVGTVFTYSARLADGSALPAWLSFDAATRTFSGTPTNGDVGTLSIAVTANDGNGGTVTDSFNIVIANTNDAPVVASLIPDQIANEDAAFRFQFAANTFTDVDSGTVFTYSAQLAGGDALPAWLSFDAATRTFSGTPANGDVGVIAIDVIASDSDGAAVYDTFNITVVNTNDAPVSVGFAPVNNREDAAGDTVDLWAGFSDPESAPNQMQYSLVSNSNPALVSSAVIDPATGKLQLAYGAHQFGSSDLVIRAQDPQGAWVDTALRVNIESVNDVPTSAGIADVQVAAGAVPQQTNLRTVFSDIEQGAQLQYVLQGNSNPTIVPQILLDSATGTMTLSFASLAGGESVITLRALDAEGAWVETQFKVTVTAAVIEIPVMPPGPDTSSPTTPPTLPPIETPVLTPPEVNPPGMGGGTGGGGDDPSAPANPGDMNPVVPVASISLSDMNGDGYDRDLQGKSSLDYQRAEDLLAQRDIASMTLAPTTALESLITPDAGFAPWEAAEFDSEVRRMRAQMDEAMDEEQERKAVVAGLTFSVTTGILIWALRASTLLLTMMSMLPLWRGFDPLPILDEVDKKKKELEQQRKDREREDKNAKEVGYLFDHAQNKKSRP